MLRCAEADIRKVVPVGHYRQVAQSTLAAHAFRTSQLYVTQHSLTNKLCLLRHLTGPWPLPEQPTPGRL